MYPEPLNKPLFGLKAIAAHCGVSINVLRKWIKDESFPAAKDPRWMITTAKIAEWVEFFETFNWVCSPRRNQPLRQLKPAYPERINCPEDS
jgi:hypothetical protein